MNARAAFPITIAYVHSLREGVVASTAGEKRIFEEEIVIWARFLEAFKLDFRRAATRF